MRILLNLFISLFLFNSVYSQDLQDGVLFWTAQDWECEYLNVEIYLSDSILVAAGKLNKKYTANILPECGNEKVLNFEALPTNDYFFVADCTKEACYVCDGEGSYWQPTVQSELQNKNLRKNKGQIGGVYKTCNVCNGNGAPFQILWIDTFTIQKSKCRTVLLK